MIIDVHHHYIPKRFFDEGAAIIPGDMEAVWNDGKVVYRYRASGHVVTPPMDPTWWYDEEKQLRAMDRAGVDHAVVSVACFQDWMTGEAATIINDSIADLVSRRPDRFSGMMSVVPDGGDAMVRELRRAKGLGLRAVNITTTHRGRYPDHPDFGPLFETAVGLGLPIYVHPSWQTPLGNMAEWDLERTVGKPTDLNLAVARLVFSGRLTDLPQLRMLFAHLGGSLPFTLQRLFYGQRGYTRVPDLDYATLLKRVFVDTGPGMWWSPVEIECAAKILSADQMMLGSDYPLSNDPSEVVKLAVDHVTNAAISQAERGKILSGNAIEFFDLTHLAVGTADATVHEHKPDGCC